MSRTRNQILPDDSNPYFLTLTVIKWLPLFSNPDIAKIVLDSLDFLQRNNRIVLYAYVLMENHLHLIASSENLAKQISEFKSFTARKSIDYYEMNKHLSVLESLKEGKLAHRVDRPYQFWQEGNQPKRIHDMEMMQQKIAYIHQNPVKRGYVDEPTDWRYSSARNYEGMEGLIDVCMDW